MYDTSDLRKGLKVTMDGSPFVVVEAQFVKPGKGQAFTRTKLKNLITGNVIERTLKSGERIEPADVEEREMQFLYKEGESFVFMDTETYDQLQLTPELIGDNQYYLLDGTQVQILLYSGRPIGVTPPTFVEMTVTWTEPGFKGDTSSNISKPAKMQTGLEVGVPLFIKEGELIRIDTRTGEYVERVKK
jgi:elongation factor P